MTGSRPARPTTESGTADPLPRPWLRAIRGIAAALVALGALARALPLLDHEGRLLRQYPTEDGYLLLTIARNLALGKGFTVSDGLIATNGTQPLATLLYALGFVITGGDREGGVAVVIVMQLGLAAITAWLLFRIARALFAAHPEGDAVAALVAGLWFASPVVLPHTMNCLETGLYACTMAWALWLFLRPGCETTGGPWGFRYCLGLGVVLGLVFWARNDAVFFIAALCLAHLYRARLAPVVPWLRRFREACVFGAASVVVALPWLWFNHRNFGSIVPISGTAEALDAELGGNLYMVASVLLEYLTVIVAVPARLQEMTIVAVMSAFVVAAAVVVAIPKLWRRGPASARLLLLVCGGLAVGLVGYYGVFFGATHFIHRYLFPLSLFFALGVGAGVLGLLRAARPRPALAVAVAALAFSAALSGRAYLRGKDHEHFQVVGWVKAHVPPDAWVGAPQTGTLGFFHDRTINLDGKVNPEALAYRRRDAIPAYILEKDIDYLADWEGLHRWKDLPELAPHFELVVHDRAANLAVLARRR